MTENSGMGINALRVLCGTEISDLVINFLQQYCNNVLCVEDKKFSKLMLKNCSDSLKDATSLKKWYYVAIGIRVITGYINIIEYYINIKF